MELPMDVRTIMKHLPHRFPFLLVDRILEIVPDQKIIALKNVTINEPFFQGHFPGTPIMPGVLIVEAMAQAGGVLAMASQANAKEGTLMFFMGLDQVKFRKPVVPGDQLIIEVEILKKRAKVLKLAGLAKVDGQVVAEGQLMATFEG
ncbi:MAG: 3-hydroxyacyl-ACP dehydratase FabZ [Desulfobacteraceae bacterium]|nr:3-hydroxyacyl-ACP dehydratase FabZ [Desulfobacteraceae bacterium]